MNKKYTMKKFYRPFLLLAMIFFCIASVWAFSSSDSFVVRHIRVVGNRGLSSETVLNYLPLGVGQTYTPAQGGKILEALYGSGFFSNVNIDRQGNTLIVSVAERPTIASVKVIGNKGIKKGDLKKSLKDAKLTVGNIYNRNALERFKQNLKNEYYEMGYYAAKVTVDVKNLPRDRVAVTVNVNAGKIAKVESINFVGNRVFSDSKLKDQMYITTPKLWSFFTKGDQYSKPKLDASLQKIENYYMNRGYLHFKVISSNAALTPDRKHINITIVVSEGSKYRFGAYEFSGKTIVPVEKLNKLVTFKPGQTFSRAQLEKTSKAVAFALGDLGYAFAQVEPIPAIDEQNKTVAINFHIVPGKKVYVRHIIFKGNTITADYVLRRSMQQMEGGLLSSRKVEQSVRKLKLLGFFKNVSVQTVPVPGTNNQVDLIYNVSEAASGQATASIGYGTLGWQFGAGIVQPNFLGTGKTVGVNFTTSSYQTSYSINYYNPYYTIDNIGRGMSLFYVTTSPDNLNLSGSYAFNSYGGNVYYNIPVSLNNTVTLGYGLSHTTLRTFGCAPGSVNCIPVSNEVNNFVNQYGRHFNEFTLNSGWQYNGLDRAIFPTDGFSTSLNGEMSTPVFSRTLKYYKIASASDYYLPINEAHSWILNFYANLGYGNGYGSTHGLPFFMNYYAGGLATGLVRGYETNTLGPKDSNNEPIGGNVLLNGGLNFIFPNPISPDNLRTSLFVDAGNTYQTMKSLYSFAPGPVRLSMGLGVQWRSPMGPIDVSLAMPLNKQQGDESEPFQFTMGTSF